MRFAVTLLFLFLLAPTALAQVDGDQCFCYNVEDGCGVPGIFDPQDQTACQTDCEDTYGDSLVEAIFVSTLDTNYETELGLCQDEAVDIETLAADTDSGTTPTTPPIIPQLSVDIPGLEFSEPLERGGYLEISFIGQYVAALYRWMLTAGVIVATVMIMIGGVQYMIGRGSDKVDSAKKRITGAVIGMVLLLGSYVILYTVNPQLTLLQDVRISTVERVELEIIDAADFTKLTGKYVQSESEYVAMADEIGQGMGLDRCVLRTIAQTESSWNPLAIGHDENAPYEGVGSRTSFIRSKTRYSGSTFEYDDETAAITNNGILNDDPFNAELCDSGDNSCGLDTRFSHGIGIAQFTILTSSGKMTECDGRPGRVYNGACYNIADLFDPEISLTLAGKLVKDAMDSNGGDIHEAFKSYVGTGPWAETAGDKKYSVYLGCQEQEGL